MSTFICEKCGCIDNSSCGGTYNSYRSKRVFYKENEANTKALCCVCTPTKYIDGSPTRCQGRWHERFERKHWTQYGMDYLIEKCKKDVGDYENAIDFFSKLDKNNE